MAAAGEVKLPLAIKKAIKDMESEKQKSLDRISKVVGSTVTMNWVPEQAYGALEADDNQKHLASAVLGERNYLGSLASLFDNKVNEDALVKEKLNSVWKTKNITFTIVPENFDVDEQDKTKVSHWHDDRYIGLRILDDGNLDMFTKPSKFFRNTDQIGWMKIAKLLTNAKVDGELPLEIRQELRDEAGEITKVKERIAKAVGVDAVTWNIEADLAAILPMKDLKYPMTVRIALDYLKNLAALLEKNCADEMVKEAIQEVFTAKEVGMRVVADEKNLPEPKGLVINTSYNGVQIVDGKIYAFAPARNLWSNVDQLSYEHNLISLF